MSRTGSETHPISVIARMRLLELPFLFIFLSRCHSNGIGPVYSDNCPRLMRAAPFDVANDPARLARDWGIFIGGILANAHAIFMDVLAFGCACCARGRVDIRENSVRHHVRVLGRGHRLGHSGDRLHRQDDLTQAA
jgi:hypothetical protein